jgi:uncharacterized membrane protein
MDLLSILIVLALIATVVTMLMGLISMGGGESLDKELSEPLMWARVGLQGLAIILLLIAIWLH